jgi:hypothetical protein
VRSEKLLKIDWLLAEQCVEWFSERFGPDIESPQPTDRLDTVGSDG